MGRGQLLFKGDKKKKSKKKSKSGDVKHAPPGTSSSAATSSSSISSATNTNNSTVSTASTNSNSNSSQQQKQNVPTIQVGKGKITTSGTVVMGQNTIFEKQLAAGDALLVRIPGNKAGEEEEMRVITMRLSNTSCNLSSGFTTSIKVPTSFRYIKKPKNPSKEKQDKLAKAKLSQHEKEMHAFGGTYASNTEIVYREKTETGSYRIKRESGGDSGGTIRSRGELLQLRAKKSSDKYC